MKCYRTGMQGKILSQHTVSGGRSQLCKPWKLSAAAADSITVFWAALPGDLSSVAFTLRCPLRDSH